jgi:uncharacterized protein (DUF849 family)
MSNPVIITAALTGALTTKERNPDIPCTPAAFAEEALEGRQGRRAKAAHR